MSVTTFITYNGDGVTTDFAIPFSYDSQAEVVVTRKNGTVSYTFQNPSLIRVSPALAAGDTLSIQRITNIDSPAVVYKNGSGQTGGQLNKMVNQLIKALQELKSTILRGLIIGTDGKIDFANAQAKNVGTPTDSGDIVTKSFGDANYGGASATQAAASATQASNSASAAATSATNAATSATNAANSATAAANSATAAANSASSLDTTVFARKANNLSDLQSVGTARGNLGVYSTAQVDTALAGKANSSHTHAQSDVTGLTTALSGKADTSLVQITKQYVSAQQTITASSMLTLAHGLGVVPKFILVKLVCITADANYAVGTELHIPVGYTYDGAGVRNGAVSADATNVYFTMASNFVGYNRTTAGSVNLASANWKIVVSAFA